MLIYALKLFTKIFLIITAVVTVFLYFFAIILEPVLFYLTPEGINASTFQLTTLSGWFLNIQLRLPISLPLGVIFLGLWSIFILSFVGAWKLKNSFHIVIKESLTKSTKKLFNNSLFAMSFINNMALVLILLINSLQEAGGIPTGTPPIQDKPFVDFFALSYSVVVEEIGFRLLPIGIFLLVSLLFVAKKREIVFSLKQKIKLFFVAILVPDKAKKMADTKTVKKNGIIKGISIGEWGILLFTSLVFGLAHFNPGFSWEIGKISSAAVSGLIIGLSYLIYGAPAAIILHWFFNSYIDTFFLLSEVYPIAEPFANVVVMFSIILGVIGWGYVIYLGYHRLVSTIQEKQKTSKLRLICTGQYFLSKIL
jgi:hypothetical protein